MLNSKLEVGVLAVVAVGMAAVLLFQQQRIKRLLDENAGLRTQLNEAASLRDSNGRLTEELKTAVERAEAGQKELTRLRGQVVRLRQVEQENTQLNAQRQQLEQRMRQPQPVVSTDQGQVTALSEVKASATNPPLETTDLGSLELQSGIPVHFDLGGGTNCVVTPTALPDGNNMMQIQVGVTNAEGTFSQLAVSRITARPGQHCSISVGDRMIALAVKTR